MELVEPGRSHPSGGALASVVRRLRVRDDQCFFWATHAGAELDLLVIVGTKRLGFEFKRTDAPRLTASMRTAMDTLRLDHIDVVHAGPHTFPLAAGVRALALSDLLAEVEPVG